MYPTEHYNWDYTGLYVDQKDYGAQSYSSDKPKFCF